jgi:hypothetical protein
VNYSFQFGALAPYADLIVQGAFQTLQLSAITMAVGLAIGLAGALARTSRVAPARCRSASLGSGLPLRCVLGGTNSTGDLSSPLAKDAAAAPRNVGGPDRSHNDARAAGR